MSEENNAFDRILAKGLDGMTPARQARSEATLRALVAAGREIFATKEYDQVSVGEIVALASSSVGAFYSRFNSKETFFVFLQEAAMAEVIEGIMAIVDELDRKDPPLDEWLESLCTFWVSIYRDNRGLYRASYRHTPVTDAGWTPYRRAGHEAAGIISAALIPRLAREGIRTTEHDVRAAFQIVNGVLVNAVLNNPGPVCLDDAEMERNVVRIVSCFLAIPRQAPRGTSSKQRKTP